jgi:hypothetical protein
MAQEETQAAATPEVFGPERPRAAAAAGKHRQRAQEQRDIDELAQVEFALKRLQGWDLRQLPGLQ